jgi:hypothetical protein
LELSPDGLYDYPTVIDLSIILPKSMQRALPPRFAATRHRYQMETFSSLMALLARRAESQPDERAYIFLGDRGAEEATTVIRACGE